MQVGSRSGVMTSAGGAGAGLINRTSRTSPTAAPRGPTAPRSTQSTTYRAPARGSRIKCMPTQAEGRGAEGDRGGAVYARAPRRPLRAREGLSIDPHQWDPLWCSLSVCRGASRCTLSGVCVRSIVMVVREREVWTPRSDPQPAMAIINHRGSRWSSKWRHSHTNLPSALGPKSRHSR